MDFINEFEDNLEETLHEIRNEDLEGVSNVKDELNYNSGWYNYSLLTFDYKGNRYSVEYKEHTSDNVSDFEFILNTLTHIGSVEELSELVTKEELIMMKKNYEAMLAGRDNTIKVLREKNEDLMKVKKAFVLKNDYSNETIRKQGENFMEAYKGDSPSEQFIFKLGESLVKLSNVI